MFEVFRRVSITASIVAALASAGLSTASAQAKSLVLRTSGQGPLTSLEATMTSTTGSLSFEGDECGTTWPGVLRWKLKVSQLGGGFTGSVSELNAFDCVLPSGQSVTIEPDPHPWPIKMTPAGKAPIKGNGQRIELLAQLPGEDCVFESAKIGLTFAVAGPLHPVPLEPGDPALIKYNLNRALSGVTCPRKAGETLQFNVTSSGPAGEEQVFDEG